MATIITRFNPARRVRSALIVVMGIMLLMLPALAAAQSQAGHNDPRFVDQRSECLFMEENIPGYDCDGATAEYAAAEHRTTADIRLWEDNTWDHQPVAEYQIIEPSIDGSTDLEFCRFLEVNISGYDCAAVAEFASTMERPDITALNLDRWRADVLPADVTGAVSGVDITTLNLDRHGADISASAEEATRESSPLLPPAFR